MRDIADVGQHQQPRPQRSFESVNWVTLEGGPAHAGSWMAIETTDSRVIIANVIDGIGFVEWGVKEGGAPHILRLLDQQHREIWSNTAF